MLIAWINFEEILLEKFSTKFFFSKFQMCIFKVKHYWPFLRNSCSDWSEMKMKCVDWLLVDYVTSPLTLDFSRSILNNCISGIVGLIDMKQEESKAIACRTDNFILPFDHTHDLGLGFSRSKFEIACLGHEKDANQSQPWLRVTRVGWMNVSDYDWGDFKCQGWFQMPVCCWHI